MFQVGFVFNRLGHIDDLPADYLGQVFYPYRFEVVELTSIKALENSEGNSSADVLSAKLFFDRRIESGGIQSAPPIMLLLLKADHRIRTCILQS